MPKIILASTSPYRKRLLTRLGIPFDCHAPGTDETPLPDEAPEQLSLRLARDKARAVSERHPGAWVVGSDQVAALEGGMIGKSGNRANAIAQLQASSGKRVDFYTAIALTGGPHFHESFHVEQFSVYFQTLSDRAIEAYVDREQPYDCAGSFKWESLGIVLFERLCGEDPTSLEGLPLIALTRLLRAADIDPLL